METIKMLNLVKHPIKNIKYFAGILHGSKSFIGPNQLQIILTNDCKNQCIYCWHRSPLKKQSKSKDWLEQKLDFDKVKGIIDDAIKMKVESILLSGGGEPFLYPEIYEVIKYVKKKGLKCFLITNGMHIDKESVKRLFDLRVDKIWLNLSSGSAKGYVMQQPNQTDKTFYQIREWLSYLKNIKKKTKSKKPYISLVNIISKTNYSCLDEIFDFGEKIGADEVYLKPLMPIRDTLSLLLTKEQKDLTRKRLLAIKSRTSINHNITQFLGQITHKSYIKGRMDMEFPEKAPCYIGWAFAEILANGDVIPCCASPKEVMGNIYLKRFKEIWYSKKYNSFRKKSKKIVKDKTLKCACIPNNDSYICPNNCILFPYNVYIHKNIRPFNYRKIIKQQKANL